MSSNPSFKQENSKFTNQKFGKISHKVIKIPSKPEKTVNYLLVFENRIEKPH